MFLNHSVEIVATACFAMAILHTFLVKQMQQLAHRFSEGSVGENFFHLLGEVEVVFGAWAIIFLAYLGIMQGKQDAVSYLEAQNFTEPAFVFVIMVVCATRPILNTANRLITAISKLIPLNRSVSFYVSCLVVGPLLGSLITEPAAMTVTALILLDRFYKQGMSPKLMYATLGLLFVNISIGGTLTPYAAPPVLMVAAKWNWDVSFMLMNFGWKTIIAVIVSTTIVTWRFKGELATIAMEHDKQESSPMPLWVPIVHVLFLGLIVWNSHHLVVFIGIFLLFLGLVTVTKEYHHDLKLREGLLVAFFLGGLVILGTPQRWWLEPLLSSLNTLSLFLGSAALTAITDNAALTYLGAQVPTLSEASRYALVAGAVTGGGLTVIANAPNPAGYGILNPAFGTDGISPLSLLLGALMPTAIAALCFWFL